MWEQYKRIAKQGAAIVLTASQPFTSALIMSNIKQFKFSWVWDKKFAGNFALSKYQPQKVHEDVVVFSYGTAKFYPQMVARDTPIKHGANKCKSESSSIAHAKVEYENKVYHEKNPESLIHISNRSEPRGFHPTQKPVALMEYLIKTSTTEGEIVLDNTFGSCSTGVACVNLGRKFIGIEMDENYYNIGKERVIKAISDKSKS